MDLSVIKQRNRTIALLFIGLIVITVFSMHVTDFNSLEALIALPSAILWMVTSFYPNSESLVNLPSVLIKLKETVFLAIVTTTTASIVALLIALLSKRPSVIVAAICRLLASASRNIPDVVWAIVLLFSFGQNIISGYFAIFFASFGFLTRAFIEAIDEASSSAVEAIEATGASYLQVVFQAIIPSIITQIVSWVLFMIETNIRSSTLVGMLTATGVGHLFNLYYKSFDYHSASLVVLAIVTVILVIEYISNYIRRVIL